MTSTPTGESILETTRLCHSTLNLKGTSLCLWARCFTQVGLIRCILNRNPQRTAHAPLSSRIAVKIMVVFFSLCRYCLQQYWRLSLQLVHPSLSPTFIHIWEKKGTTFTVLIIKGAFQMESLFLNVNDPLAHRDSSVSESYPLRE